MFGDPLVNEALEAYGAREHGIGEALLGGWDRAPRRLVEAVGVLDQAMRRTRRHLRDLDDAKRESERRQREAKNKAMGRR